VDCQVLVRPAAAVERRLERGHASICRGGARLAKARHNLDSAGLTQAGGRARWEARRWFITADGEAGKPWGNETIRVRPAPPALSEDSALLAASYLGSEAS
jgi:hypothetical protein